MYRNNSTKFGVLKKYAPKLLFIMRLTIVILIATMLQVSASSLAQKVTFVQKEVTLGQLFKVIKAQTGYNVVWYEGNLDAGKTINANFRNTPVEDVMDQMLKDQPLSYTMNKKTIVIKEKTPSLFEKIVNRFTATTITGFVIDTLGNPLVGATVKLQGTKILTRTGEKGLFRIETELDYGVLVIAYLGFKTEELRFTISTALPLKAILKEDENYLKEVLVVSTGYQTLPKERATGSFTQIDNKTLNRSIEVNILDRLEGLASGLLLNRNLTNSANNPKISIRGRSTIFANAEPLIVLDGMPYEGSIEQINANDIETINLLKDAAAASIWGTRASNGVIVITSKRGSYNKKPEVSMSSNFTMIDKPDLSYTTSLSSSDFIDMEAFLFSRDYYKSTFNLGYKSVSGAVEIFNQRKNGVISKADSASRIDALKGRDIRNDLKKYKYRLAGYQQYQLNVRGGGEFNKYYLSGGYDRNLENLVTENFNRYTVSANNTYSLLKDRLKITGGINFTSSVDRAQSSTYTPFTPYDRLADENGNSVPVFTNSTFRPAYLNQPQNAKLLDWNYRPKDEMYPNNTSKINQYRFDLGTDLKILDGLNLIANYQYLREIKNSELKYDASSFFTRNLINTFSSIVNGEVVQGIPYGDILYKGNTDFISKIFRAQLNFNKVFFSDHEVNAIAGYEGLDGRINTISNTIYGFDPELMTNGNSLINPLKDYPYYYNPDISRRFATEPGQRELINITQSYYANASYSYLKRYILSGSIRKDESNLFGVKTNQKGVPLWSSGIAWIINREDFYGLDWLPSLKLRATYGYNGNIDKTLSALLTARKSGLRNEWTDAYSLIVNPPNPDLKWEKVKTWNIGLDFSSRNNRLSGSVDVYQKNAYDLIGNNPIAIQSGVTEFRGNGANLLTKGIDVVLNSNNINGKFKWASTLLFNYNTDKVTSYKIKQTTNLDVVYGNYNNPLEGYPYYAIFSFPSVGLDNKGMPQGYVNGNISSDYGTISRTYDPAQLKFHGSASPKYFGSLINTFSYGPLELSLNITYKLGYFFRRTNVFSGFDTSWLSTVADYDKRWQKPGDELITRVPAFTYPQNSTSATFFQYSEDVVEPGDHIRLQDIRLSYDIKRTLSKLPFKSVNIYGYAKNLGIIWSKTDTDVDPDYGVYSLPQPPSYSLGINLTF